MIVLAALIHLPLKLVAGFGLAMIALHNLLDRFQVAGWQGPGTPVPGFGAKLWILAHQPFTIFPVLGDPSPIVLVVYPLIPWIGVMAVGYAFGSLYQLDAARRRRWLLGMGVTATWLFIFVRALDVYGDPAHWSKQKNVVFTVLSFVNTTKYPPSLQFLLMTLGPALLALWWFDSSTGQPARVGGRSIPRSSGDVWSRASVLLSASVVHGASDCHRAWLDCRTTGRVAVAKSD